MPDGAGQNWPNQDSRRAIYESAGLCRCCRLSTTRHQLRPVSHDLTIESSNKGGQETDGTTITTSFRAPWHWCRILGQIADFFVVLETDEGMILMDPQAAHERVLFDRFMREVQRSAITTQGLLVPETITLPPVKSGLIRKHLTLLHDWGWCV